MSFFAAKGIVLYNLDHFVMFLVAVMLFGILVIFVYNRIYIGRTKRNVIRQKAQNTRLALVLKAGRLRIWKYVLSSRRYHFLSEEGSMEQDYSPIEFSQFYDRDDFESLRKGVFDICEGKKKTVLVLLLSSSKDGGYRRHYEVTLSVDKSDEQGRVLSVLGIQHDVTEEHRRIDSVNQLLMRYQTVFNSSLVDMLFYDNKGVLKDLNERACEAFGVSDRSFVLDGSFLLKNNPMFEDVEIEYMESTRTSSIVDFSNYQDERYHIDEFGLKGKMYYESTINPIRDADGKLEGVFMAGRNITEMVESYHRLQAGIKNLQQVTSDIQHYIQNINYALRISDVRMVNYYPNRFTLEMSDNISQSQMRFSQLRCIRLASPRFRRAVSSALNRMDHQTHYNINVTIETELRDKKRRQIWLMFNLVPIIGQDGNVERYFGLCRNLTDLVETEQRLAVETKKARETELLKQAFLANMSYEIRTPLNNVVGFAGLLTSEHDESDEAAFVEQIKKGTNSMLLLVNDVLLLSQLDANMVEYTYQDVDFAQVFESRCQMGWLSVSPAVKTTIDNPYENLVVHIDESHLGYIIEKVCHLACLFTVQGRINARCEYRRGELVIGIEDTGIGIDEATLPHAFERFVRDGQNRLCGTGLDLPIVQLMAQQMGGDIELESKANYGTSLWISIPCEAKTIEKRHADKAFNSSENILL